ncbi:MAG: MATE family efflux transporter [Gammaproteobacteria bacterium]
MKFPASHAEVWRLAGPLILSNISIALLGLVDTAVVGHLHQAYYLGAVAIGAVIFDFLYWGMGFLRMGTTGIVAQAHGKGYPDEMRSTLLHAVLIALVIALTILLLKKPIIDVGLHLIGGSAEVKLNARIYFMWAIWGSPAVLISITMFGWLLGMQNAKATLYIAITINIVNIILDVLFVFGLNMDVRGVALASVISEYSGMGMAAFLIVRELKRYPGMWRRNLILDARRLWGMILLNQNIFIRTVCLIFVFAFFTRQGARQGDLILAANAILINFQTLMALGLDGFANAAEALAGKAIGANNRQAFVNVVKAATAWSVCIAIGFSLFYGLIGGAIIDLMTSIDAVRTMTYTFLPWMVLSPLISVWCFLLDGIFIGATRAREMRDMMLIATFLVFLPAWYFLQPLGNNGLWLAFMLFFAARGLTLGFASVRIERTGGFVRAISKQSL